MNYSIKFYPEKRKGVTFNVPIMLSVTYSKQRMFYYTGLRCNIDEDEKKSQWKPEGKKDPGKLGINQITPDGKTSTDFNNELTAITAAVNELFKVYDAGNVPPSPDQLRNDLKRRLGKEIKTTDREDFFSRFDQYIREADLSDSRKTTLNSILKKLKTHNPQTTFTNLDPAKFQTYLADNGISSNTRTMFLNGLKTFIKHSNDKGYTSINSFKNFKIKAEQYGKPIYLSIEERNILFNATIEDKNLSIIRDIFCLQCFIGCRYSDLIRLKHSNIIDGYIEYIAAKTKEGERIARIPLSGKAKEIISRYNQPDGRLLPFIKLDLCNYLIKKLFRLNGLTRNVTIKDKKTLLDTQVEICEIASTHMARRIFIGGLHKVDAKNEVIASMSGHVAHSKSFARYYEIDKETQMKAIKLIE